ncbi:NADH-dependent butanol dehydrogenase [Bifidobacterium lemurum]|uniref:NADH-dependent butanol dehydrogenase n=1 Tax=Bifidobacterium lemurum TaxID=1603886 RepID=A0A261FRX2_9BIFI|nr:iron-containing alcohol dehydrogenase [Bifidobacterium lemurum]OZG61940.1 NADH-dependent butanol dehydrogenase [Bifidobacterium lemurum]QOL35281.1 iron-containing alcohol dehydrogenase [Bifidobacterium lemurum]
MFQDFSIRIGTEFVFGRDVEREAGPRLAAMGAHTVLVHHDGGAYLEANGLLDAVRDSLRGAGLDVVELGGVRPNPRLTLVREGVALAVERGVDAVLAIGGGSVIDSAKAIALGAADPEIDVWDYFTGAAAAKRTLPVAVVLTVPASGSESSQVTVINNEEEHLKLLVSDPVARPALALMNPALSATLPAYPTACGIVDMFSHICERYFCADEEFGVIDRMAEGALRTLVDVAPRCLADLTDYECRAQIMWISTIAQNNTLGVGRDQDWGTHTIANELSALYDTPHGATLSIIMGPWMRVASERAPRRFARYAQEVFGVRNETMSNADLARRGIEATEDFFRSLGMPTSFAALDLPRDGVERMLDNIAFYGPDDSIGSVARLDRDDCRRVFELAFGR